MRHRRPVSLVTAMLLTLLLGVTNAGVANAAPAGAVQATEPPPEGARTVSTLGFDTCVAPTVETMRAWRASPYRVVGIYIAGGNRACKSERLTPEWIAEVHELGWDFLPIQVGFQAQCTLSGKKDRIDAGRAREQGVADADEVVTAAKALGFKPGSAVYFDMEAYSRSDTGCRDAVLDFVSAWSARVRELGYTAGYYSSLTSGIADLIAVAEDRSAAGEHLELPDAVWYARWDGQPTTSADGAIPGTLWENRRVHQYSGNVKETHGGVEINIDRNAVDGPVGVL